MASSQAYFSNVLKIYFFVSLSMFLWYSRMYQHQQAMTQNDRMRREDLHTIRLRFQVDNYTNILDIQEQHVLKNMNHIAKPNLKAKYAETHTENKIDESEDDELKDTKKKRASDGNEMKETKQERASDGALIKHNDPRNITEQRNGTAIKWMKKVKEQNSLYEHPMYMKVKGADVFYISALGVDSKFRRQGFINRVLVNGWLSGHDKNRRLFCCLKQKGKNLTVSEVSERYIWDVPDIGVLTAAQFACEYHVNPRDTGQIFVGLSVKTVCKNVSYIEVKYEVVPETKDKVSFAVCAKIVYGNYSASRLLEWFEYNKASGVDAISLFTYNVTHETMKVLKHYQKEGLLYMQEFDFPLKLRYPRHLGQKYAMAYMDEQVTVFDCVHRFRRFSYITILDVDEFIMPDTGQRLDFKAMMKNLQKEAPKAAGFTMMTKIFVLDWNMTHPQADLTVGQYTQSTLPMIDRPKSIILPSRVELSSVWTHRYSPKLNYTRWTTSKAMVFHYRHCRQEWIQTDRCLRNRRQYASLAMKTTIQKIRQNILSTRKIVLDV